MNHRPGRLLDVPYFVLGLVAMVADWTIVAVGAAVHLAAG
jgi:hypothetical protein